MGDELVSCVIATGNRNEFLAQVLDCFRRQSYDRKELVVVDDGKVPAGGLCAGIGGVKYIRLASPTPTGTKLNLGIEAAAGSIVQKMDDDDYYAPRFLETAVTQLQDSPSRRAIVAWDCFLILLAGSASLHFSGHGWLAGGTFCFRREVWEAAAFRDVATDEDAFFLDDNPGPRIRICEPEQYVLVRHGANTWREFRTGADVDDYVRSLEPYPKSIAEVTGEESARFYAGLRPLIESPG